MSRAARARSFSRQRCSKRRRLRGGVSGGQRGPVRLASSGCTAIDVGDIFAARTRAGRSASRRARSRTPRCRRACRPACPRACSGLMYAAVPRITPAPRRRRRVIVGDCDSVRPTLPTRRSIALARPKSSTFTAPSGVSLMFAGFRSRWTIPFSCAASSASAICRAIASASSSGIGPLRDPLGERRALDQLQHERARRRPASSRP